MNLISQELTPYEQREELEKLLIERNYEKIGELPGIKILEKPRITTFDCLAYVSNYLKDPRILENENMLYLYPKDFFRERRYQNVKTPEEGIIVAYHFNSIINSLKWGVTPGAQHLDLIKNSKVNSKWGKTFIYEHDLNAVPECYGNLVSFFKKI